MSNKFPKIPTFICEKISASRVAIYENGVYICQLQTKEVQGWIACAEHSARKFEDDEAAITVTRIINALEYLAHRKNRASTIFANSQISMF